MLRALQNQKSCSSGFQNPYRAILYGERIIGGHQSLDARLIAYHPSALSRLFPPLIFDFDVDCGIRSQASSQIFANVSAHSRLHENQNRRSQEEHDCENPDEKCGAQMFEAQLKHLNAAYE